MTKHKIPLTPKQLSLIATAQASVERAVHESQLVLTSILAGHEDLPGGSKLSGVSTDPPELVFEVPEPPETGQVPPKSRKRGKRG